MKVKDFYLFHRTNTPGSYLIVSLHWRWSITWRWALWVQLTKSWQVKFHCSRRNGQHYLVLHLLRMLFTFQTQRNIRRKSRAIK